MDLPIEAIHTYEVKETSRSVSALLIGVPSVDPGAARIVIGGEPLDLALQRMWMGLEDIDSPVDYARVLMSFRLVTHDRQHQQQDLIYPSYLREKWQCTTIMQGEISEIAGMPRYWTHVGDVSFAQVWRDVHGVMRRYEPGLPPTPRVKVKVVLRKIKWSPRTARRYRSAQLAEIRDRWFVQGPGVWVKHANRGNLGWIQVVLSFNGEGLENVYLTRIIGARVRFFGSKVATIRVLGELPMIRTYLSRRAKFDRDPQHYYWLLVHHYKVLTEEEWQEIVLSGTAARTKLEEALPQLRIEFCGEGGA